MGHITVRRATTQDVAGISDLFAEFIGHESNLAAMETQLEVISANANDCIAGACDGAKVIGTSMGIVCYDFVGNCNPSLLIENVVVLPQYRSQGVGKRLMQSLEEFGNINRCNYVI